MKTLPTYILALCLLLAASSALAGRTYKIEQDLNKDGDYTDANEFLGYASAWDTDDTLSGFYGYTTDLDPNATEPDENGLWGYGFNGPVTTQARQSHLFLVDASDGLGLIVVHGENENQASGEAEMRVEIAGNATLVIEDDDDDNAWDEYEKGGWTYVDAQWKWGSRTDGLAINFDLMPGTNSIEAQFIDLPPNGVDYQPMHNLNSWVVMDSDNTEISLTPTVGAPVRLTLVPLPATAWPALAMLGAIGLKKWRSRRKARSL